MAEAIGKSQAEEAEEEGENQCDGEAERGSGGGEEARGRLTQSHTIPVQHSCS